MHVWFWFLELHQGRSAGFGANPLAWSEIEAWARLTGVHPARYELIWLRELDLAWLKANAPKKPRG